MQLYVVIYDETSNGKAFDVITLYLSEILIGMMQDDFWNIIKSYVADAVFDIKDA